MTSLGNCEKVEQISEHCGNKGKRSSRSNVFLSMSQRYVRITKRLRSFEQVWRIIPCFMLGLGCRFFLKIIAFCSIPLNFSGFIALLDVIFYFFQSKKCEFTIKNLLVKDCCEKSVSCKKTGTNRIRLADVISSPTSRNLIVTARIFYIHKFVICLIIFRDTGSDFSFLKYLILKAIFFFILCHLYLTRLILNLVIRC